MATITELMPYLEQGFTAYDPVRHAYLTPEKKEGDELQFSWTAYEMEGEWSGPDIHSKDYVLTWRSDRWGIVYTTHPNGSGSELETDKPEKIVQVIADGLAHKAKDFRAI